MFGNKKAERSVKKVIFNLPPVGKLSVFYLIKLRTPVFQLRSSNFGLLTSDYLPSRTSESASAAFGFA